MYASTDLHLLFQVGPADAGEDDRFFREFTPQSRRRAVLKQLRSVSGPSSVLYLSHLPRHVSMEVLYEHMKQFGDVKNMKIFESSGTPFPSSLPKSLSIHTLSFSLLRRFSRPVLSRFQQAERSRWSNSRTCTPPAPPWCYATAAVCRAKAPPCMPPSARTRSQPGPPCSSPPADPLHPSTTTDDTTK